MKVKIVKCSNPGYWYSHNIGETFEVQKMTFYIDVGKGLEPRIGFEHNNDFFIDFEDAEIIKETKMKVVEKKSNVETYPCLKQLKNEKGLVILFTQCGAGFVLRPARGYSIGEYETGWSEENFELYNGTLEISNGDL